MSLRGVLLLAVAVLVAGLTAFYVRHWISAERAALRAQAPKVENVVKPATPHVLVAKEDLPAGSFVRAQHLKWQPWPDDGIADGYVVKGKRAPDDFEGAVVRNAIVAGQPITDARVVHPGDRGFLAAVLTPGSRAVSVPVNATTGIAGFVFPGDWVDIILTVKVRSADEDGDSETRHFSETLLTGVRVLAVDQKLENDGGKVSVAKTATLEVTPKQAEKVALALHMGDLSLSLHSLAREEVDGDKGLFAFETAAGGRGYTLDTDATQLGQLRDRLRRGGTPSREVTVMRGDKVATEKF